MLNLAAALYGLRLWPVKTNAAFLLSCLQDPVFQSGEVTTSLIADRGDTLTAAPEAGDNEWMLAAMQSFGPFFQQGEESRAGPWASNFGFRLNSPDNVRITLRRGNERRTMNLEDCTAVTGFSMPFGDGSLVFRDGHAFEFTTSVRDTGTSHGIHDGEIEAPMPGKVTAIEVSTGQKVALGQRLLTLEAMKMEHALTAPFDGTIAELRVSAGTQVTEGQLLVRVEAEPEAA
jgi:3-methylcrotonyl-CoA carboxylase alpha subunit